ncbi:DNA binding methylated-DNA--cysteine S-methyltransferase [Astrocystis sublimbata]|nr:DNA binding methylated-DNA--cysteine S-methyltransferase [Astrocystis sublimbata]
MTRSDEAASFFIAVYNAVQEIPEGRVTSYGHIAKLVGTRTFVHVTKIVPSCQIPGPVTHILPFPCTQSIYLAITSHISFYVYTTPKTNSECLAYCKDGDKTAERPRQVGVCLKHLSHDAGARHNNGNVPWQRVINAKGIISPRYVEYVEFSDHRDVVIFKLDDAS